MEPAATGAVATVTAILAASAKPLWTAMRAGRKSKRDEVARCEARCAELSAEIKAVRDRYEAETTGSLTSAAVAITTAAEVQREGNILQRESIHVQDRMCRILEALTNRRADEKTPAPAPMLPRKVD